MNFIVKQVSTKRSKKHADVSHVTNIHQVSISDENISSVIKTADINKKDMFNNRHIEKSDLLMNVTQTHDTVTGEINFTCDAIYAESYYVDSEGDIIKTAHINGVKCVIVELCDISLARISALCDLNITDDTSKNSSGITRTRVVVASDSIQLVKVTLGFYRNYLKDKDIKGNRTTYQDAQNKTVYETDIMCAESDIEKTKNIIKSINKASMIVEWYM